MRAMQIQGVDAHSRDIMRGFWNISALLPTSVSRLWKAPVCAIVGTLPATQPGAKGAVGFRRLLLNAFPAQGRVVSHQTVYGHPWRRCHDSCWHAAAQASKSLPNNCRFKASGAKVSRPSIEECAGAKSCPGRNATHERCKRSEEKPERQNPLQACP